MMSEKRVQKFQKHFISISICARFSDIISDVILSGKQWWCRKMSVVFSGNCSTCEMNFLSFCVILEAIGANTCALLNCKNYWKPPHQEVSKHWTWVISEHGIGMLIDCPAFSSLVLACISSKPLFSLVLVASIVGSLIGSGTHKLLLQWCHQGSRTVTVLICQTLHQHFFFVCQPLSLKNLCWKNRVWVGKRLIYAAIFTS